MTNLDPFDSSPYSNGKIYLITCNITGHKYIGSTCSDLETRLKHHKANYVQYNFSLVKKDPTGLTVLPSVKAGYTTSFMIIKNGDYKIELLEACQCETAKGLREYEKKYIIQYKKNDPLTVNKNIPNRNKKEYYLDNQEHLKAKQKNYDDANRERILKRMQVYYAKKRVIPALVV